MQENESFELVFDLIGFELDPTMSHQTMFFTPDTALLWMDINNIEWRNRTGLVMSMSSGIRSDSWQTRWG